MRSPEITPFSLQALSKQATIPAQLYRDDLARIHIDGYGFHWEAAAPVVLAWLQERGINSGLLVDLGCGGGQWLAQADKSGYETVGIDVSPSMIQQAKRHSPNSTFVCASCTDADIPDCDAVTALGEPLNYLNSGRLMRRTIKNVFKSIRTGGLFIFDARHPPRRQVAPIDHHRSDEDWFCHARIEEDQNQLTRRITTFCRVGKNFRRDQEFHRLKLFSKHQMLDWLRKSGFRVRVFRSYGNYQLAKRQSVFVCHKP